MDLKEENIDVETTSDIENESSSESRHTGRKRNYHNILERKRRNHIKDGYLKLRDAVPSTYGKKVSRIQILKRAIGYIQVQTEAIKRREAEFRKMRERAEVLRKVSDFMKTKDLVPAKESELQS